MLVELEIPHNLAGHFREYVQCLRTLLESPATGLVEVARDRPVDSKVPGVYVVLATAIPEERCKKVNLGYMDPAEINIADYENKEDQGVLVVHHAGEVLYRLKGGYTPTIPGQ